MGFYQFKRSQHFEQPVEKLWEFISNPSNLKKITPESMGFDITSGDLPEEMYAGMIISYKVSPVLGIKMTWVTEITHVEDKKFFVDEKGEQLESLDIKQKGTSHIVESIRAMAIRSNIHETSTIERLNILSQRGLISRDMKNNIHSAFEFMLHLLLQSQRMKKESSKEIDNFIDPENLSLLEKPSFISSSFSVSTQT